MYMYYNIIWCIRFILTEIPNSKSKYTGATQILKVGVYNSELLVEYHYTTIQIYTSSLYHDMTVVLYYTVPQVYTIMDTLHNMENVLYLS